MFRASVPSLRASDDGLADFERLIADREAREGADAGSERVVAVGGFADQLVLRVAGDGEAGELSAFDREREIEDDSAVDRDVGAFAEDSLAGQRSAGVDRQHAVDVGVQRR